MGADARDALLPRSMERDATLDGVEARGGPRSYCQGPPQPIEETFMFAILRRTFVLSAAAAPAMPMIRRAEAQSADATPIDFTTVLKYPFVVPPLPYAYDANEPSIDAQTMQLHHDKHHGAYVANLNSALKDQHEFHDTSLPDLLARLGDLTETNRTTVRNNAGGHAHHTMFWQIMGGKGGEPEGELAEVVTRDFGSFDKLKSDLNQAALRVF